jgi:hypothetical protein
MVRDGAEALDFLFCAGVYTDRDPNIMPEIILPDLNLPKVGGLAGWKCCAASAPTNGPVCCLLLSLPRQPPIEIWWTATAMGQTPTCANP